MELELKNFEKDRFMRPSTIIGITCLGLFLWLATYSYQQIPQDLGKFIDEKNREMIQHKMAELYGNEHE